MAVEGFHKLAQTKKYLLFLSYVGHEFRGVQKQPPNVHHGHLIIVNTVQETLENAISASLRPLNFHVGLSSRTDAGVHALRTSVQCSLILSRDTHPDMITSELNKNFMNNDTGMRIQSTQLVPPWFSARFHATSRTYVYRFAIRKEPPTVRTGSLKHTTEIPFSEHHRTFFIQSPEVNITRMQEAASLITGTRDYFAFMGKPSKVGDMSTVKSIYSMTITPTNPFMPEHDPNAHLFNYWNLTCTGRSFLYRQIRRIMGVIIAVGNGSMSLEAVHRLLNEPCIESWDPRAVCVPPWGLYLADVTYNPLDINPDLINQQNDDDESLDALERRVTYALSS